MTCEVMYLVYIIIFIVLKYSIFSVLLAHALIFVAKHFIHRTHWNWHTHEAANSSFLALFFTTIQFFY